MSDGPLLYEENRSIYRLGKRLWSRPSGIRRVVLFYGEWNYMKIGKKSEVVIRIEYRDDSERAEAALEILQQGFRRGMLREASANRKRNLVKDCEI